MFNETISKKISIKVRGTKKDTTTTTATENKKTSVTRNGPVV